LTCLRCDGKGEFRNEFGLMEKCTSCQREDMALKKTSPEQDPDEEGMWGKMTKKKDNRKSGRLQKGEKKGREQQRVKKYKRNQQEKKKKKKPKKYYKKEE